MKSLKILEVLEKVKPVLQRLYINNKDAIEEFNDVALQLHKQYLNLNKELVNYLERKNEEFAFLSKIEETEKNDSILLAYARTFKPANIAYLNEVYSKLINTYKALKDINLYLNLLDEDVKNEIEDITAESKDEHNRVVYLQEEVEYLEPLARGFVFRQDKKQGLEL